MPDTLTNRLRFLTNSTQVLTYLRSHNRESDARPIFSFNSIRSTPKPLKLQADRYIRYLSLLNSDLSRFDEDQKGLVVKNLMEGLGDLSPQADIETAIDDIKKLIQRSVPTATQAERLPSQKTPAQWLDDAIANYRNYGYFSYIDWRLAHWGTVYDVCSVVEETFNLPTEWIEFETKWSAPVTALQYLANTFPSVRFELLYRFKDGQPWAKVELFPTVPFGY